MTVTQRLEPDFLPFEIDGDSILPILQRSMYRDPYVSIRECGVQNARDAIRRRAQLQPNFNPIRDGRIVVEVDTGQRNLRISDNGNGMSREELVNVYRWYGVSNKRGDPTLTGVYGLGAKSMFGLTDAFIIHTKSLNGETSLVYVTLEGLHFLPPEPRDDYGTTITATYSRDVDEYEIARKVREYAEYVEVPMELRIDGQSETVSQQTPTTPVYSDRELEIYLTDENLENPHYPSGEIYVSQRYARLYVDRIPVRDQYHGLSDSTINIRGKNTVNLTATRDNIIEDERWEAFKKRVGEAVEKMAGEVSATFERNAYNELSRSQLIFLCKNSHDKQLTSLLTALLSECTLYLDPENKVDSASILDALLESTKAGKAIVVSTIVLSPRRVKHVLKKHILVAMSQGTWKKVRETPVKNLIRMVGRVRTKNEEKLDLNTPVRINDRDRTLGELIAAHNQGEKFVLKGDFSAIRDRYRESPEDRLGEIGYSILTCRFKKVKRHLLEKRYVITFEELTENLQGELKEFFGQDYNPTTKTLTAPIILDQERSTLFSQLISKTRGRVYRVDGDLWRKLKFLDVTYTNNAKDIFETAYGPERLQRIHSLLRQVIGVECGFSYEWRTGHSYAEVGWSYSDNIEIVRLSISEETVRFLKLCEKSLEDPDQLLLVERAFALMTADKRFKAVPRLLRGILQEVGVG